MSTEKRLRDAITARTSSIEPSPTALHHIKEKLMESQRHSTRNRFIGVAAAAAIVAVVVGIALVSDNDTSEIDTTGTTVAPTTTTTSTTAAPAQVDSTSVVFPDPDTARRFDDPKAVTLSFARDLLGFSDPIVGEFRAGDSRSGEVDLRAFAQSTPTIVLVRRLEDDTWFVIGATVESIRLDSPKAGATITSPEPLRGAAFAFEGHVDVALYADGIAEPIAKTYVTGAGDEMGDFSGELTFEVPDGVRDGVLVLSEGGGEDGATIRATVIRVHF